jgi:hypothetical protein
MQRGDRQSFMCGWLTQVESKVIAFAKPDGHDEIINTKVQAYCGFEPKAAKNVEMGLNDRMMEHGAIRGQSFSIHRPMGGVKNKLIEN